MRMADLSPERRARLVKLAGRVERRYHGSASPNITTLRAGSYVTPYAEDAAVFAVPWSSSELTSAGRDAGAGRPPRRLSFKGDPPPDSPVHIYEVVGPTKPAKTNTGKSYPWNRVTTEDLKVRKVETIPSWRARFLSKTAGHVEDRAIERTPQVRPEEIAKLRSVLRRRSKSLRRGETYHYTWPGRGHAVIGDVGKSRPHHVVKTMLRPDSNPPGRRIGHSVPEFRVRRSHGRGQGSQGSK